jgi:TolB protein
MKRFVCSVYTGVVLYGCICGVVYADQASASDDMTVAISACEYGKMPLLISIVGQQTADVQMLVDLVKHDLTWSGQFEVSCQPFDVVPSKKDLLALADKNFPLLLFVQRDNVGKGFEWRLYDTTQPVMLKGKHMLKRGVDARMWAHELADMLWPLLTGQEGLFSTKIAYCKEVKRGKKRPYKYLCVADYDGSNEVVRVPTIVVAPRWGKNGLLFFSECTNVNIRLMYVDIDGSRHVASNFDGLNMLPSFSQDGKISVFCASRGEGNCQLYYCAPGILKKLTHNQGNNVSPTLTADASKVYFCSDYKSGYPGIYVLDIQSGKTEELIKSGMCPSFSAKSNKLAYLKKVKGTVQVFSYALDSGVSEQLTKDSGDKDECCWSSCGNYIYYSVCQGYKSRIVVMNALSREQKWVTSAQSICTYPAASPIFGATISEVPAIKLNC